MKAFTEGKAEFDHLRNHISASGLIRHFILALNVNLPTINAGGIFEVPGWSGFSPDAIQSTRGHFLLEPGGFMRVSSRMADQLPRDAGHSLEAYRVLRDGSRFKILRLDGRDRGQSNNELSSGEWKEDFIVLINTSEVDFLEVEL